MCPCPSVLVLQNSFAKLDLQLSRNDLSKAVLVVMNIVHFCHVLKVKLPLLFLVLQILTHFHHCALLCLMKATIQNNESIHFQKRITYLTFPFITSKAFIGVNFIVLPFRQLLSVGCVNNNLPSRTNFASS